MSQHAVDTLIFAPYIVPMEGESRYLTDHAIAIKGRDIVALLPQEQAQKLNAHKVLHLDQHVLMPGLINLHAHSAMALLRGFADDLVLSDWLEKHIWPAERRHVDLGFVYDGSLLAAAEMIRGGTTCVNDMYFFPAASAKAAMMAGMRVFVSCSILEFPTNYAPNADEYIHRALQTQVAFMGEDLVQFVLAPHAPYTVSDASFAHVVALAEKENMLIHCHVHETAGEINESLKTYGERPLARLDRLGLLTPRFSAAHMVHLNDEDMDLARARGISVAHCPASNLKLASGIAPVAKLLASGVNTGLGTDGAASNNRLDMFSDMRLAALLAKGAVADPTVLKADEVLQMATINGARALQIADKTGSLKVGKRADIVAVDLADFETQPIFDPISHLVYAAGREQVSYVWVNGEMLLDRRQLTRIDTNWLMARIHQRQKSLLDA